MSVAFSPSQIRYRGIITNAEVSPTNANVVTSPDKKSMIWNAGR